MWWSVLPEQKKDGKKVKNERNGCMCKWKWNAIGLLCKYLHLCIYIFFFCFSSTFACFCFSFYLSIDPFYSCFCFTVAKSAEHLDLNIIIVIIIIPGGGCEKMGEMKRLKKENPLRKNNREREREKSFFLCSWASSASLCVGCGCVLRVRVLQNITFKI